MHTSVFGLGTVLYHLHSATINQPWRVTLPDRQYHLRHYRKYQTSQTLIHPPVHLEYMLYVLLHNLGAVTSLCTGAAGHRPRWNFRMCRGGRYLRCIVCTIIVSMMPTVWSKDAYLPQSIKAVIHMRPRGVRVGLLLDCFPKGLSDNTLYSIKTPQSTSTTQMPYQAM